MILTKANISIQNIKKAKEEIARLEEEEANITQTNGRSTGSAKKPAQANDAPTAETELTQEKDAVADASEELKKASLEDQA